MKKRMFSAISLLLALTLVLCSCNANTGGSTNSASTAVLGTDAPKSEEKAPLSMFMITATISYPDNFDFANNFVTDAIEEMANVDITEVVVPPDSDTITKFNLMMSSGDMTDVIHYASSKADVFSLGKTGAFVELTDYIKNSPRFSSLYSDAAVYEQLKADDGKIYAFRALPVDGDANCFAVRWDLLKELGYEEMPTTLDGWLDAMRALKAKYPDSLPYISRNSLHWAEFVYKTFGCAPDGYSWQYYKGDVIHTFENPMYKDALNVYRTMLNEGLMDKEFATDTVEDFQDKRLNRKVLVNQQNIGGMVDWIDRFPSNGIDGAIFIPAQYPMIDDERIERISTLDGPPALNDHTITVSSLSKQKDAAFRLIEALYSDEMKELTSWGREGIEYNLVNGEKVLDTAKATESSWRRIYNFPFGYNTRDFLALSVNQFVSATDHDDAGKAEYEKLFMENLDKSVAARMSVPMNPIQFIMLETDNASRLAEARNEAMTITIRAMLSEISMEEFDAAAAEFVKKYQFITDDYNSKIANAKAISGIK